MLRSACRLMAVVVAALVLTLSHPSSAVRTIDATPVNGSTFAGASDASILGSATICNDNTSGYAWYDANNASTGFLVRIRLTANMGTDGGAVIALQDTSSSHLSPGGDALGFWDSGSFRGYAVELNRLSSAGEHTVAFAGPTQGQGFTLLQQDSPGLQTSNVWFRLSFQPPDVWYVHVGGEEDVFGPIHVTPSAIDMSDVFIGVACTKVGTPNNQMTVTDLVVTEPSCLSDPDVCAACHACIPAHPNSNSAGCVARPGMACDDGDACSVGDACDGMLECRSSEQRVCADCEYCDTLKGCVGANSKTGDACADPTACIEDGVCLDGVCDGDSACSYPQHCVESECIADTASVVTVIVSSIVMVGAALGTVAFAVVRQRRIDALDTTSSSAGRKASREAGGSSGKGKSGGSSSKGKSGGSNSKGSGAATIAGALVGKTVGSTKPHRHAGTSNRRLSSSRKVVPELDVGDASNASLPPVPFASHRSEVQAAAASDAAGGGGGGSGGAVATAAAAAATASSPRQASPRKARRPSNASPTRRKRSNAGSPTRRPRRRPSNTDGGDDASAGRKRSAGRRGSAGDAAPARRKRSRSRGRGSDGRRRAGSKAAAGETSRREEIRTLEAPDSTGFTTEPVSSYMSDRDQAMNQERQSIFSDAAPHLTLVKALELSSDDDM